MASSVGNAGIYPDLKGKRVLITGASGGIGRAAALAFAANGCKVVVTGRSKERLQPVVEQVNSAGGQGFAVEADLNVEADWARAVQEALDKLGGLDVLVNNGPGIADLQEFFSSPDSIAVLEATLKINVLAALGTIQATIPSLLDSKGSVINVSSVMGSSPNPDMFSYGIAKSALDALTASLALKYAKQGVRFNTIKPGSTRTPPLEFAGVIESSGANAPMDRISEPSEQAAAIVFLGSAASSFMTGTNLVVDGGWLRTSWNNARSMPTAEK